jgi:hypothetical protein
MTDKSKTSDSVNTQNSGQQQQSSSVSVYRDRDPLAANISWSSIKTAWKEIKSSS